MLTEAAWRLREADHQRRADALTAAHRERKQRGEKHPVEDFLWTYYSVKPSELRRWHPGTGVLEGAADRASWKYYRVHGEHDATIDLDAFFARRGGTVDYVDDLLRSTLDHAPRFGCFGLHEWAMVYRMTPEQLRHTSLPLRIGHEATDRVVESHPIGCTHFDAFRFFTPSAAPLNALQPTRETQPELEQSGCLHAGMDVYKWAAKLGPIIPGELLLDCFELARDIREVDMQASPYDVTGFFGADGSPLTPIAIETAEGKREYVRRQRVFAERGDALRRRVLAAISAARAARRA
ncbi:3-methyladenine DNA glycosylase [Leucobacter tenebrionis]|uniref:3-methyladenine DNA glycosylase n=1 Tax=Leucobacter tenebrionis TaxID=2873270 RepID=UPI001CA74753|nr:3-methyladenine DNA glycosylase [Leucobacter tenebrionis]QZY53477.1 3-methyladenine DNA glycosylase [Leucobacter tenebrionis]